MKIYQKKNRVYYNRIKNEDGPRLCIVTDNLIYKIIYEYLFVFQNKYSQIHLITYDLQCTNYKKINACIASIPEDCTFLFLYRIIPGIIIKNKKQAYFLNTEQLSREKWLTYVKNIDKDINLLDYSYENVNILAKHNIKSLYVPYPYNMKEIKNVEKVKDIAIIAAGAPGSRRQIVYSALKPYCTNIQGYGNTRDDLLFQHKIIVNIHIDSTYNIFEEIRCTRCIFNKMIVITEDSANIDNYMYRKNIIVVPYNQIVTKTLEVLENYDYYYNLLGFKSFRI